MISESEALAAILPALNPLASRRSALSLALGDFARTDLYAPLPLPQFDNSAMDGIRGDGGRLSPLEERRAMTFL